MAVNVLLSVGDGNVTDDFDLTQYIVEGGITAPPPEPLAKTRAVELMLNVNGADADALWAAWGNIEKKLHQARKARGVYGQGTSVTLSLQLDTTNWVYFDILDGTLAMDTLGITLDYTYGALSLVCLPYARGAAVTKTATATLTNGAATWLVEDIPGDAPALARLTIEDVSTSTQIINGVHVYQRTAYGLASGDFDHLVDLTAATPGSATTDSSSYSGANFARITATSTWRTIAEATRPTGANNDGLFDLWLRLRDHTAAPSAPRNLSATVTTDIRTINTWSNSAAGSATSIAVTLSPSPTSGNILIAVVGYEGDTTPTTPTGFTLASDGADNALVTNTVGTPDAQLAVYWKVSDGSETSVSVTTGTATNRALWVREVAGLSATPVEQVALDVFGIGTANSTNNVTRTQAYQLEIAAVYNDANGTYSGSMEYGAPATPGLGLGVRSTLHTSAGTSGQSFTHSASGNFVATLVTFKGTNSAAPNLTADTYTLMVVAEGSGGEFSPVAGPVQVAIASAGEAILLDWDAPAAGTVTGYRVYWDRGDGWRYLATGSTATAFTITTETGATVANPDLDGTPRGLYRIAVGLASGTTVFAGPSFSAALANGVWEDVFAGTFALPPIPALDGDDPPGWLVRVEGSHPGSGANLDVDLLWLAPYTDPQLIARSTGYTLDTATDWVLDQRRDRRVSGRLYADGTTTDAGQVDTIGQLTVGPGNTQLALRLTGEDGVSDVDDLRCIVTLRYVPRFKWLRGT